jgi:hypothetical protein
MTIQPNQGKKQQKHPKRCWGAPPHEPEINVSCGAALAKVHNITTNTTQGERAWNA